MSKNKNQFYLSRPTYHLHALLLSLKRKGYAHYIKNTAVDDFIGNIRLIKDDTVVNIDIGVSDNQAQYYIETYVNDELVYEHGTNSNRIVMYQVDKAFDNLKK